MNAEQWRAKILAITNANASGDPEPLAILCEQLAAITAKPEPVIPVKLEAPASLVPKPKKPKAAEPKIESELQINTGE